MNKKTSFGENLKDVFNKVMNNKIAMFIVIMLLLVILVFCFAVILFMGYVLENILEFLVWVIFNFMRDMLNGTKTNWVYNNSNQ